KDATELAALEGGLTDTGVAAEAAGGGLLSLINPVTAVIAVVLLLIAGFVAAAVEGVKLAESFAQQGAELERTSERLAIQTQDLSVLRFAAKQSGVEYGQLTTAVQFFSKQIY